MGRKLEEATELEWLRWFFNNADFGPADTDVRIFLEKSFYRETGKFVPNEYTICQEDK